MTILLASLLAALACPSGTVRFVGSAAAADYTVRFVSSEVRAKCVVRMVRVSPRPGEWEETGGIADFTVFETTGLADLTVYIRP